MVNAPQLPSEVLQRIALQIADRVPQTPELSAPGAIAGLGESLRIAVLPQNRIEEEAGPIADRVIETGQWHHQIYSGDMASNFARSTDSPAEPGMPAQVVEVAESTLATDLRRTIAWVDSNVDADGEAEVLAVPSHFLTALWLRGPHLDAIVVASAPADMAGIELNQIIPSAQFLKILAQIPAVEGLGLPEERDTDIGAGA